MKQLVAWHAYYRLDPFGEERADLRIAQLAAFVGNMLSGKKGKKYKSMDFMPYAQTPRHRDRKPIVEKSNWDRVKGIFQRMHLG